jgi:hypothetical protein
MEYSEVDLGSVAAAATNAARGAGERVYRSILEYVGIHYCVPDRLARTQGPQVAKRVLKDFSARPVIRNSAKHVDTSLESGN